MPKRPSSWVNLQDYLGVNADQGKEMAQRVAGDVGGKAKSAADQLGNTVGQFNQKLEAGTNAFDPKTGTTAGQAGAKKGATYTGPKSLGDVDSSLAGNVSDAVRDLGLANTSAGRAGLLGKSYKGGGPIGGQGAAGDAFLMGTAGSAEMSGLQSANATLGEDYAAADKYGTEAAGGAQLTTDANNQKWGDFEANMLATEKAAADQKAADAKWQADFDRTDKGDGRLAAKTTFEYLDPLNYIGGGKRNAVMNWLGGLGGEDYKGNISWTDSPEDRAVYSQMDKSQWDELSKLTGVAQKNWIQTRATELATGKGRKRGKFQSHYEP